MDEVYRIADRITILRDGPELLTERLTDVTPAQIVEGIVGKEIDGEMAYRERGHGGAGEVAARSQEPAPPAPGCSDVSFTLHAGEILGLAGLMGSGRTELARVLFGIDRSTPARSASVAQRVDLSIPATAIDAGIALIPEDRRAQGLVLDHSVRDNLLLPLLEKLRTRTARRRRRRARRWPTYLIERFAGQGGPPRPAGAPAVGRQPAEGRHRQVARHRSGRADHGRADRRGRHRHQDRDPRP